MLEPYDGADAVPVILALAAEHPVALVAIDPRSNAATLLDGLEDTDLKLLRPDVSGMAVAWGRFHDWTLAGRLKHRGHPDLTVAVRLAAGRRTASGAQQVDRRGGRDPAPVVAAELAVLALGAGEDYDVLNSVY